VVAAEEKQARITPFAATSDNQTFPLHQPQNNNKIKTAYPLRSLRAFFCDLCGEKKDSASTLSP